MGRYILGEFEHLVLLAVLQLGDAAYGVSITDALAEQTDQDVAQAAVYLTLRRLEEKGWLESHGGATAEQRRGRVKKFYRVTPEGAERLADARDTLRAMWASIGGEFAS